MIFNVLRVNQTYFYSEYQDRLRTSFELGIDDNDDDYLEIGEHCIVSAHNNFWAREKKQAVVSVTFYDIATFENDASTASKRRRSMDKPFIGTARFAFEPESNVPLDFDNPPVVTFEVWLSSGGYTHLQEQLKNKNFPAMIILDFQEADSENGLGFSYALAPNRSVWKIDQTKRVSFTDLDEVSIEYQPFQRTSLDITAAKVNQEADQEAKKQLLANRDADKSQTFGLPEIKTELTKIRRWLLVATIILGLIALTN